VIEPIRNLAEQGGTPGQLVAMGICMLFGAVLLRLGL